jgi:hypothetical protein
LQRSLFGAKAYIAYSRAARALGKVALYRTLSLI